MDILYQICEITATATETVILLDFMHRLLTSKHEGMKNIIQFLIAFTVITSYMIISSIVMTEYSAICDLIGILLYVVYSVFFMKSNFVYRIIVPIISIIAILSLNLVVSLSISRIFGFIPTEILGQRNLLRVALLFITKFIFFMFTRIFLLVIKPSNLIINKREIISISVVFIISCVIIGYSSEIYYNYDQNAVISKFLIILIIGHLIINIIVIAILNMIAKKNKEKLEYSIMKAQYDEQKKSYDSVQSIYHNFQMLQHDLKNEMLLLYKLVEEGKRDEAMEYLTTFTNTKFNSFQEYIKTGNSTIDAIMNVKLNLARENSIDVKCSINIDISNYDIDDILRLLSNAIDNAIEACVKQKNARIEIKMQHKRSYLFITVCNTILSSVLEKNSKLKTTKKEKELHGFGTQTMKYIAEKYDGAVDFYETESMFVTDIMLKKPQE